MANTDPNIGKPVEYVDEHSQPHAAIVTAVHGEFGVSCINLVYVSADEAKHDPYGRQLERASSVQVENEHAAHGRFYRVVAPARARRQRPPRPSRAAATAD